MSFLLKSIFDVEQFFCKDDGIVYTSSNSFFYLNLMSDEKSLITDDLIFEVKQVGDAVFFQGKGSHGLNYFSGKKITSLNGFFYLSSLIHYKGDSYFIKGKNGNEKHSYVLKTEDGSLNEVVIERYPDFLIDGSLAIRNSDGIVIYNYQTGDVKLKYNFNDLLNGVDSTLMSKIVLCGNKLFFYLTDFKTSKSATICLDYSVNVIEIRVGIGGWLQFYENRIFATNKKVIQIINPISFEISFIDVADQLPFFEGFLGMSYRNFAVHDDLFFFAGERTSDVGAIRLSDKKLIWHTYINVENENNPLIREIKADRKRLYVLDHANTLHVFDRDSMI